MCEKASHPSSGSRGLNPEGKMKISIGTDYQITIRKGEISITKGIFEITDRIFNSHVLQSDKPVLLEFWAPGYGPCESVGPVVEKLAEAYGDQFRFARCNVHNNPMIAGKLEIRGIPTLMFFKGGKLVDKLIGMVPKSTIEDAIIKCLSDSESAEPVIA
jgi:thioredoxin 1